MLHILLLLLKIIGIVLLCILGILLLGIVCVLFVPFRYQIEVTRREGEGEPPVVVKAKATWLLHLINVLVQFTGKLTLRARIFLIPVFRLPGKEKRGRGDVDTRPKKGRQRGQGSESRKSPGKDREPDRQEKTDSGQMDAAIERAEPAASVRETENKADLKERVDDSVGETAADREEPGTEETSESTKKLSLYERLRKLLEKVRALFQKIKGLFENIQYTIRKFCDRIRAVLDQITYYRGVIEGEAFQNAFALCKEELLRTGKALKPKKFEAALIIGLDDPAATGEVLAVCGMLYPLLGGHVDVSGDFERKRLEGRVFLKGKLRLFTFLRVAVRLFFNKDIRKLYKLLKKEAV